MKNNEFKIKTELKVKIFGAYCVTFNNFSAISLHIRLIKGGNHYISDSSREGIITYQTHQGRESLHIRLIKGGNHYISDSSREGNMDIYKELSGENSGFE